MSFLKIRLLENMNFYQQERFRDKMRLKFHLETVIQKLNSFNSCCKVAIYHF
jgi:hypothetical protein